MIPRRLVTRISKKDIYYKPHERIESIGGDCLCMPWKIDVDIAIYNIKEKIEEYYVLSANNREMKVIVAVYEGKEYLKTETDNDSPDNLLGLPELY